MAASGVLTALAAAAANTDSSKLTSSSSLCRRGGGRKRRAAPALLVVASSITGGGAPKGSKPLGPCYEYSAEVAIQKQLEALRLNDKPYIDHGIEVLYRFAGFDPFQRSLYFGRPHDLGQFERFRRLMHHPAYRCLLNHCDCEILSTVTLDEHVYKQRILVRGWRTGELETYQFTLKQRVGGRRDGYWLTDTLLHDGSGLPNGLAY